MRPPQPRLKTPAICVSFSRNSVVSLKSDSDDREFPNDSCPWLSRTFSIVQKARRRVSRHSQKPTLNSRSPLSLDAADRAPPREPSRAPRPPRRAPAKDSRLVSSRRPLQTSAERRRRRSSAETRPSSSASCSPLRRREKKRDADFRVRSSRWPPRSAPSLETCDPTTDSIDLGVASRFFSLFKTETSLETWDVSERAQTIRTRPCGFPEDSPS